VAKLHVMKSDKKLNIGVIGCGRATETRHLPALARLPCAEVVGLADINSDLLHRIADGFGIEHRHQDYRRLLDDVTVDAVAVCVPAHSHVEVALAAMAAGKHVLIEKPLAITLADAERISARAAENPELKVMMGLNMRWHRLIRKARAIIETGGVGKVESVRSILSSYHAKVPDWGARRCSGGGVLFELAVHHIDLWRYLLGCEVEEIYAESRSAHWDDEYAAVTARMTGGTRVSSVFSQRGSEVNEVEIYGEDGRLAVSLYEFDGLNYAPRTLYPGDVRARLSKALHLFRELPRGMRTFRGGGDFFASYIAEWRHFLDAIQRDSAIMEGTLMDGRRSLEAVLAAVASLSLRGPVKPAAPPSAFASGQHSFA
jgi:predicted dehydrogenase